MEQNLKKLQQEIKNMYEQPKMSEEQVNRLKQRMETAKKANRRERCKNAGRRALAVAASIAAIVLILPNTSVTVAHAMQQIPLLGELIKLVTVRDYEYEDENYHADMEVGELVIDDIPEVGNMEQSVQEELKKSTEEINAEIQRITEELIEQFEENVEGGEGHLETIVESEILATTEEYFTVKLFCFRAAGSGYQWNYYYTIDLSTGKQLKLEELFVEGADYVTPISENIKAQMKNQMEEDKNKSYWLDSSVEEWNFKQISEDVSFYVNANGNIVICFDEGDVAPMYMGVLEFEIDKEVLKDIRK